MGYKHHNQQDFSGGEVSPELYFRDNMELHSKALNVMRNFIPNLQGNAVRTPGTQFVSEVAGGFYQARIIPYITPTGDHTIALVTPESGGTLGSIKLLNGINGDAAVTGAVTSYVYINKNHSFVNGFEDWWPNYLRYVSNKDSAILGWYEADEGGAIGGNTRVGHNIPSTDPQTIEISQVFNVAEDTSQLSIRPWFSYDSNGGQGKGVDYPITVNIFILSATQTVLYTKTVDNLVKGGAPFTEALVVPGTFTEGQELTIKLTVTAQRGEGNDGDAQSLPVLRVEELAVVQEKSVQVNSAEITDCVPYSQTEIRDVHFVQSPYRGDDQEPEEVGKELVMTHGKYDPKRLYLGANDYVFENIFEDEDPQRMTQWKWATNGYPSTCTSYRGRLVLAGSTIDSQSVLGTNSETVWTTKVGEWGIFTDFATAAELTATDSVTFTSIYRSPIRWAVGKETLLIGAESMEYTVSSTSIFKPGDVQVDLLSTHGSNFVQPVVMGKYVMFPAENGRRLRGMFFEDSVQSWVSPDFNLQHPRILWSGIKRLVRMRNPHQMVIAVLGDGELAVLSLDDNAEVAAWSRINVGGAVLDAAVLVNQGDPFQPGGEDVLYLLVKRNLNGVDKLYVEAIPNWVDHKHERQQYLNSHVGALNLTGVPTNIIGDLDHLESNLVQVMTDGNYQGMFEVKNGEVELVDQFGDPVYYISAYVGLPAPCLLRTMPLASADPGSIKRFTSLVVQTLTSIRPIVNGIRPPDRDPSTPLGRPQPADIIRDNEIPLLGSDLFQVVDVEETLPYPITVQRIYGKVTENSV